MSVEFEENISIPKNYNPNIIKTNKFGMYLVNKKIAKDEKQANIIMLCITLIFFTISGLVFKTLIAEDLPPIIPYEKLPETQKAQIPESIRKLIEAK